VIEVLLLLGFQAIRSAPAIILVSPAACRGFQTQFAAGWAAQSPVPQQGAHAQPTIASRTIGEQA